MIYPRNKTSIKGEKKSYPVELLSRCKWDLIQTTKEKEKLFYMYLINYVNKIIIPKSKQKCAVIII